MKRKRQTSVIFPSYMEIWELPAWTHLTWDRQKWMLCQRLTSAPKEARSFCAKDAPGFHGATVPWSPGPAGGEVFALLC